MPRASSSPHPISRKRKKAEPVKKSKKRGDTRSIVRIVCLVLAGLLLVGTLTLALTFILGGFH